MRPLPALLTREADRAITALRGPNAPKDVLGAIRDLPLLLRRHGLLATLGHYHNGGDKAQSAVAAGFIDALAQVAPFGKTDAPGRIVELAGEPLAQYLLHSRLALAQADAWMRVAEGLLDAAGETASAAGASRKETERAAA